MDDAKCLTELDEVLNYLSEEDLEKIPEDIRMGIKENKDEEYVWKYDETKKLKDQNLNRKTIAMLSYLNMEYLLNEEQKAYMEKIHEMNERNSEIEKRKKYNPDEIFKDRIQSEVKASEETKDITEYKESIFNKIISKIKGFFGKNK